MKKQVPSTFILNLDDKKYFFVEGKLSKLYGPVYHVYYDESSKPAFYTARNFVEEHGVNAKIPITTFIKKANFELINLYGSNIKAKEAYNTFNDIYLKIKNNGFKKNVVKKNRKELVHAISNYNDIKPILPRQPLISYEDDYEFIKSLERPKTIVNISSKTSSNSERKAVKTIEDGYDSIKTKQRILKKNVKYD